MHVLWIAFTVLMLAASALQASPTAPSPHAVRPQDLQSAIAERHDNVAAQRAAIQNLLSRPEVQAWAAKAGLDLERPKANAAVLDGEDLQRLAERARQADAQLAGGDALIIGSTTLIIILLVIIVLLVA